MSIIIRKVEFKDVPRVLDTYAHYVLNTAITFEYTPPALEEFAKRIEDITKRYPYLVIEENGTVQGFAYANTFIARPAYDWACEATIYIDQLHHKRGLGKKLYEALEGELAKMGILNMYTCIAYPEENDEYLTKNSVDFHSHLGFRLVGNFYKCGYKFNRWYNMVWMEKIIGKHLEKQPQVNFK